MDVSAYIGHSSQLRGIEEHRLCEGRGDGMRLLVVRNGLGLEFTVSVSRCCDISRLSYKGDNFSFFSVDGYVAPEYFDNQGTGWLKSFTAGFLTTCGLTNVGDPNLCDGEALPLHGYIANQPAEHAAWFEEEDRFVILAEIPHVSTLGGKLLLRRRYDISKKENTFTLTDTVENLDAVPSPVMVLYHMNMGYPLLSETAQVCIPDWPVYAGTPFAKAGLARRLTMTPPQPGIEEQCYFYEPVGQGRAAVYNPAISKGVEITFDTGALPAFTQWKMMGVRDYALGLEPGTNHPFGRSALREAGKVDTLAFGEKRTYAVTVTVVDGDREWEEAKKAY